MTDNVTVDNSVSSSAILAELFDQLASRVQSGEAVDWDAVARQHPDHADELRKLFPALAALGDLSRSAERSSAGLAPPAEGDLELGTLGDFRIIREVGRGGMGIVYEAEQISLGRSVALKVLPFAATMDPKHLQRFKNEARAAASLHHEHIVPVHFVGNERGVHFIAMQFIDGVTLAQVIRDLHHPEALPKPTDATGDWLPGNSSSTIAAAGLATEHGVRGKQSFQAAARLIMQAAEALEYAHSMGVVHRDVKPGNLMIDAAGRVWVADFGLAKVGTDVGMTMSGDLLGTLRYMSPEQAMARHGLVDHRTDVYSLGATLYELLTGQPVVRGDDKQEILRQIAFEEPVTPRKVNSAIPVDLETVLLKTLEKNPADRFGTAKELADDLKRWLENMPVRAKRPNVRQRLGKWVLRHPQMTATLLLLAVVCLAGVWAWDRQRGRAEGVANEVAVQAEELRDKGRYFEALMIARRSADILPAIGDSSLRQRVRELIKDLELLVRLEEVRAGRGKSGTDGEVNDAEFVEAFREYGIDVDTLQVNDAAERIRSRAIRDELAAVLDDWAYLRLLVFKADNAKVQHLTELARAVAPDSWQAEIREAVRRHDRQTLVAMATLERTGTLPPATLHWIGQALCQIGCAEQAVLMLQPAYHRYPNDYLINSAFARALELSSPPRLEESIRHRYITRSLRPKWHGPLFNLAITLGKNGDHLGAEIALRQSIELKPDNSEAHLLLGQVLRAMKRFDPAVAELREAVRLNPTNPRCYHSLGDAMRDLNRHSEAQAAFEQVIKLKEDDEPAHNNLGVALLAQGKAYEAETVLLRATRMYPESDNAYFNLGIAFERQGKLPEAEVAMRSALKLKPTNAKANFNLGRYLSKQGKHADAIAPLKRAVHLRQDDSDAHTELGIALGTNHLLDEAIASFREALRLKPDDASALSNLGFALQRNKQFDLSIITLQQVIRLKPDRYDIHNDIGASLALTGRFDEAITCWRQAIRVMSDFVVAHVNLISGLQEKGRFNEAMTACGEFLRLVPGSAEPHNRLAWLLATCRDGNLRNPKQAVEHARKAIELSPQTGGYWNTLGVAQYRNADYKAANAALAKSVELRKGGDALDYLFVAMAHHQLGSWLPARIWYAKAIAWIDKNKPKDEEVALFRAEADELLKVGPTPPPKGASAPHKP